MRQLIYVFIALFVSVSCVSDEEFQQVEIKQLNTSQQIELSVPKNTWFESTLGERVMGYSIQIEGFIEGKAKIQASTGKQLYLEGEVNQKIGGDLYQGIPIRLNYTPSDSVRGKLVIRYLYNKL